MSSNTAQSIILRSPDDWEKWNDQFQTRAVSSKLWDYINPENENPEPLLAEPIEPAASDYAADAGQQPRRGRSGGPASGAGDVVSAADLDGDQLKAFQMDWNVYVQREKRYQR
jgi:hypothetical protein